MHVPETADEIIFGFTPGQMKFCRNNESQMWQYLVENNLLFKSDQLTIRNLQEKLLLPVILRKNHRTGSIWLGFRIIELYMMRNPGIKMEI